MSHVYGFEQLDLVPPSRATELLGGKAALLAEMATRLGLPVPPGFAITTAACRAYLASGWPSGLDAEIEAALRRLEAAAGRRLGDPADPLLVSVRSGAPVSMPGMMDTILDLGLNDATTAGLAVVSGDAAFAADCRARFEELFGRIVGTDAPADPRAQLRAAIEAVFRSWNSARARAYRAREAIADDLGTAVAVQAMVFGNRGADSATGVLFSRNPATGEPTLYGDVLFGAQGEDVVSGAHRTEPLSVLDERLPAAAAQLRAAATTLERHLRDVCDIEFTIEASRLWLLQCRIGKRSPQAALRIALDMALDPAFPLSREEAVRRVAGLLADPPRASVGRTGDVTPLTTGLPASPGIASGEIATSSAAAQAVAAAGRAVILVRSETSPEDVGGMARSSGILTASGGLASHAAVVARGWGIPAVVGASSVEVADDAVVISGRRFPSGSILTIDGATGEVFAGSVGGRTEPVAEAATLLAWAAELGVDVGAGASSPAASEGPAVGPAPGPVGADDVVRALAIKGLSTPEQLAPAVGAGVDVLGTILERLVADGDAESLAGAARLSAAGRARAATLMDADRTQLGGPDAERALDDFVALDGRVKELVTAWQMRDGPAGQVLNDHTDAVYDAGVLDGLAAVHEAAAGWLAPLAARLPRLAVYGTRLAEALERARAGDGRYVASPRVDSYHSAWFELHEDLIRLAGRDRAAEVAAGRA